MDDIRTHYKPKTTSCRTKFIDVDLATVLAAPAAAGIHIQQVTRTGSAGFTVLFEFQYTLGGRYIWGPAYYEGVRTENGFNFIAAEIAFQVYRLTQEMRKKIEGDNPGKYTYLLG